MIIATVFLIGVVAHTAHGNLSRPVRSFFPASWSGNAVTTPSPVLPAHMLKHYPVWRVHKYNGIDMKPVPVAHWNPVAPISVVPEVTTPTPTARFPFVNKLVQPLFGSSASVDSPVNPTPFVYPPMPEVEATSTQEPSSAVDLLLLAKQIGVSDPRTLPTLEEAGNLLGTTTQQETIEAIKELIATKDGLDLIRSYIRNNPRTSTEMESRQFIVDGPSEQEPQPQTWLSSSGIGSGLDRATKDFDLLRTIVSNTEAPGFLGKLKGLRRFFSFSSTKEVPIPTTVAPPLLIKTVPEQQVQTFALPTIPALAVPNVGVNGLPNLPSIPQIYLPKYLASSSNNGKYTYVKYPPAGFDPVPQFTRQHEVQSNVLTQYQLPASPDVYSFTATDGSLGVADFNNLQRRSGVVPVRNADGFYAEGKVYKADPEAMKLFIQTPETPKAALVYGRPSESSNVTEEPVKV